MGSHQTPIENGHARTPRPSDGAICTQPKHTGPLSLDAATLRAFRNERVEKPVAEARFWRTAVALAQPCPATDAVDPPRFSKPSCPARLILFG